MNESLMKKLLRQLQSRIAKQTRYIARLESSVNENPTDSQDFLRKTLDQARKDQRLDKTIFRQMVHGVKDGI